MKRDIVSLGFRLLDYGYHVHVHLRNGSLPLLEVRRGWTRKMLRRKRVGWVPRRACVTVIPKHNRRWKR